MTKEEVACIVKYCNDNGVSYKARLSELGVPEWRFFESKRHYAKVAGIFRIAFGQVPPVDCRRRLCPDTGICGEDRQGVLKEELTDSKDDKRGAAHPERNDDAYLGRA